MEKGIALIQKLGLPCDLSIRDLPNPYLALHAWSRSGGCGAVLSTRLVFKGDETAIFRRIIHECAHHVAGRGAGHGPAFKVAATKLYSALGFPPSKPGDFWGNI